MPAFDSHAKRPARQGSTKVADSGTGGTALVESGGSASGSTILKGAIETVSAGGFDSGAQVMTNTVMKEAVERAIERVRQGASLALVHLAGFSRHRGSSPRVGLQSPSR